MSSPYASKSLSLYRSFLQLRRSFPNRSTRAALRVSVKSLFRARRAVYQTAIEFHGRSAVRGRTEDIYNDAVEDFRTFLFTNYSHCFTILLCCGRHLLSSWLEALISNMWISAAVSVCTNCFEYFTENTNRYLERFVATARGGITISVQETTRTAVESLFQCGTISRNFLIALWFIRVFLRVVLMWLCMCSSAVFSA